jgi:hypothetical protein
MQNARREATPAQRVAFLDKVLDARLRGGRYAQPLSLHIEMAVEVEVRFVNQDGSSGGAVERGESSDVVDVRMSANDGANFQVVPFKDAENALDIVSRVDHDSFVRDRVAQNRTVALQHAYRYYFVNEVRGHRDPKYSSTKSGNRHRWDEIRSKQGKGHKASVEGASAKMIEKRNEREDKHSNTYMDTPTAIMETPLIEQHRAAGAQLAEFTGCILPETFSDFSQEYRAGKDSVAIFDTNWHAIFRLTGRDRVRYLHAITSNNIKELGEGYGVLALLLNPQGHILAELEVYALKESLLVLSHASVRERTAATLKKYILGSQVTFEDLTLQLGSVAVEGLTRRLLLRRQPG